MNLCVTSYKDHKFSEKVSFNGFHETYFLLWSFFMHNTFSFLVSCFLQAHYEINQLDINHVNFYPMLLSVHKTSSLHTFSHLLRNLNLVLFLSCSPKCSPKGTINVLLRQCSKFHVIDIKRYLSFSKIRHFLPNTSRILPTLTFNGRNHLDVNAGKILPGFGRK